MLIVITFAHWGREQWLFLCPWWYFVTQTYKLAEYYGAAQEYSFELLYVYAIIKYTVDQNNCMKRGMLKIDKILNFQGSLFCGFIDIKAKNGYYFGITYKSPGGSFYKFDRRCQTPLN